MGIFSKRPQHPLAGLTARDLRRGTTIGLVNVEPDFVTYARENGTRVPRMGHEAPIALVLEGNRVLAYYDADLVGEINPDYVPWYVDEFRTLQSRKQFGRTVIYVKPEGAKSPHSVALNWGTGAFDGGIL